MALFIAFDDAAIYGLGETADEAHADALKQCPDLTGLRTAPATVELIARVIECGGDIEFYRLADRETYGTSEQWEAEAAS